MITPNLVRCRQCKAYLHGSQLEGAIFEKLLPDAFKSSPGTGLMMVVLVGFYLLMIALAGIDNALSMSVYSLQQLGGSYAVGYMRGEYWRVATSMLSHGDIVHLAFNLNALTIIGPLVEDLFERKKMLVIFIVGGLAAAVVSQLWRTELFPVASVYLASPSIGASGAVSALLGACYIGARRQGGSATYMAEAAKRWTVFMLLFGLAVSGIDNAAHIGGWLAGAGLAYVLPLGINPTVALNRIYSVVVLGLLGGLAGSVALMLLSLDGYGARLEADGYPKRILVFTIAEGKRWEFSSQNLLFQKCRDGYLEAEKDSAAIPEAIVACEHSARATPAEHRPFLALAELYQRQGDINAAQMNARIARRLAPQ